MKSVDILNLEWSSYPSRDRNAATLVCNYLRYCGYSVVEGSIFRGFELIDKLCPKVLFITNAIGAPINFQLVKYVSRKGIKVLTLISEGNFLDSEEKLPLFLWGWNNERILYEDIHMQWCNRTVNLTKKVYPELGTKLKVSGGVGFDYYKIVPPLKRDVFLERYNKTGYRKVIGIGCWDFSLVEPKDARYKGFSESVGMNAIERFRLDRNLFNGILIELIKNNEDILFILKEHPGNTNGYYESAIQGAQYFPNTLILKKESIVDCISVSDIWITYESTTNIEAWLLNKQTCLINPTGIDFPRANVYKGAPNYISYEEIQNAVDIFYKSNRLPGFSELSAQREEVIRDTIQWSDGLNHVRAGNEIIRLLEKKIDKKKRFFQPDFFKLKLRYFLASRMKIGKRNFVYTHYQNFDREKLESKSKEIYNYQVTFYKNKGLSSVQLKNISDVD